MPNIPIPSLNTDAIIFGVIALTIVYGVIAGQMGVVRIAISNYVGIVLASTFAKPIFDASGQGNIAGNKVSIYIIQLALFLLPVVLLQIGHHRQRPRHKGNMLVALIMSVLTSLLLISSTLSQLDPATLENITKGSNLASWIYDLKLWWLGLVPIGIAVEVFWRPKHH